MSLKLTELADYLMARSGQFILPRGLKSLRLDYETLYAVLKPYVNEYSRWVPAFKRFNIMTPGGRPNYDFTNDENGIPRKVFSAIPVNTISSITYISAQLTIYGKDLGNPNRLVDPRTCIKKYRAPVLYLTEAGIFDVLCSYPYEFIETRGEPEDDDCPGPLTEVEIPVLGEEETHQVLLDMLYGQFLQMIGNARGSFVYNDFPVTTNHVQMIADGKDIYEKARLELQARNRWWLAIRP